MRDTMCDCVSCRVISFLRSTATSKVYLGNLVLLQLPCPQETFREGSQCCTLSTFELCLLNHAQQRTFCHLVADGDLELSEHACHVGSNVHFHFHCCDCHAKCMSSAGFVRSRLDLVLGPGDPSDVFRRVSEPTDAFKIF